MVDKDNDFYLILPLARLRFSATWLLGLEVFYMQQVVNKVAPCFMSRSSQKCFLVFRTLS